MLMSSPLSPISASYCYVKAPALPLPLFGNEISKALHASSLATLGVGADHVVAGTLTQAALDASEKMPYGEWWGVLQKI